MTRVSSGLCLTCAILVLASIPGVASAQGFLTRLFVGDTDSANLRATIWVDPDGCEHWAIDDGIEGYMSQRRANAVAEIARSMGVEAEARGFGEQMPVADNGSAEGRAKNRRVDLHCS